MGVLLNGMSVTEEKIKTLKERSEGKEQKVKRQKDERLKERREGE